MQSILITLTTAGADTDNFSLYTDADGYVTPIETGVSKASLLAGYVSNLVPDGATVVRVQSDAICTNYVDLPIVGLTTTTTTTTSTTLAPTTSTTTTTTTVLTGCREQVHINVTEITDPFVTFNLCDGTPQSQGVTLGDNTIADCVQIDSLGGNILFTITDTGTPCGTPATTTSTTTTTTTSAAITGNIGTPNTTQLRIVLDSPAPCDDAVAVTGKYVSGVDGLTYNWQQTSYNIVNGTTTQVIQNVISDQTGLPLSSIVGDQITVIDGGNPWDGGIVTICGGETTLVLTNELP